MNYLETSSTVKSWRRSGHIRINNPLPTQGTPNIVFEEQDIVQLADDSFSVSAAPSGPNGVSIVFDPAATFPMINPVDGTVLGTATHAQFEVMLYSLYLHAAKARDDKAAADALIAQAAVEAAAFAAANPVPSISFVSPYQFAMNLGAMNSNAASSSLSGGNYGAISYTSSNPNIATVDQSGNLTTHAIGTTIITASQAAVLNANAVGEASYMLTVMELPVPNLMATWANIANLTVGSTTSNQVTTTLNGEPYGALDYTSSDTDVAIVSGTGQISAKAPGTTIITVTQEAVLGINAQAQIEFTVSVIAQPAPAPAA